jgi:hypothetical protein
MSLRRLWSSSPHLVLSLALLTSLLSVIPVQESKAAPIAITTYPAQKTFELVETQTISSASYVSSEITFNTSRKNLFAFEKRVGGTYGMYVQITGMINSGASCNVSQGGSDPAKYDGFNSPVDSLTVETITANGSEVTYQVNLSVGLGEIQPQDEITVTGATTARFNGTFVVETITSTTSLKTFTVKSTATGATSKAGAKHVRWEKLIGATDTTFTIARNPGSPCTATANAGSLATAREAGPSSAIQAKSTNMATDASGTLIFMSTGANNPLEVNGKGNLYISRNSGLSWKKVDLVNSSGVSIGENDPITNGNQTITGYEQIRGCQHQVCAWISVSVSHDGLVLAAASYNGELVFSRDGGATWTEVYREQQRRCSSDGVGVNWQEVRVSKDGKKIVSYDKAMGTIFTLDLTQAYTFNLNARLPNNLWSGNGACYPSVYSSTTNPSVYGANSIDVASIPVELQYYNPTTGMALSKDGTRLVTANTFREIIVCTGTGSRWTKCFRPPVPTYPDMTTPPSGWNSIYVVTLFMSSSGKYITAGGYSNYLLRSTNYGATFQIVSDRTRSQGVAGSSTASASSCGDPGGINSIAGSDDGKIQYFVTRQSSYQTTAPANPPYWSITPGVCRSANYGAKGSWVPVPVSMYPGSTEDISRKQHFTTVVTGSTGSPVYFGSTGVNLATGLGITCNGNPGTCLPNFWSSYSITGPPSIGTPVTVPIDQQIYSTVNAPSRGANPIIWGIGRTSNGSSVPGITISSTGLVDVSGTVPIGSYRMTITATDDGTSTTLEMTIYVYDPGRDDPIFDIPVRSANGYTVNITNYDPEYVYSPITDTGTVVAGTPSGSILPLTLSGIAESSSAIISVDSYMGTYDTDIFGLKVGTITGMSKWFQPTLTIATSTSIGGGGSKTLSTSGGGGTGAVTYVATAGTAGCSISSVNVLNASSTTVNNTCTVTATKAEDANYLAKSSSATTFTVKTLGRMPTFGTPIRVSGGFIVAITNYDAAFTWNIRVSNGSISVSTPIGSIETLTVSSLSPGDSATISVGTSRTNYSDETGTVLSYAISALTVTATNISTTVGFVRTQRFSLAGLTGSDSVTAVTYSYVGTNGTSYGPSATRPTAVGEYSVTPSAAVFGSGSASNYSISYIAGTFEINAALVVGGGSNISATYLTPESSQPFTVTGGTGVIRFTITGALSGVSIDSVTGIVYVTSASPLTSITVSVVATDEIGATDSEPITIEVTLGGGAMIVLTFPAEGAYPTKKATAVLIRATVGATGRVTFTANKRKIPGCSNVRTVNYVAPCNWKPTSHGVIDVVATLVPDDTNIGRASVKVPTTPTKRTTPRQ